MAALNPVVAELQKEMKPKGDFMKNDPMKNRTDKQRRKRKRRKDRADVRDMRMMDAV